MTEGAQRFTSCTQDSCLWKQHDLTRRLQRSESRLDTTRKQMLQVWAILRSVQNSSLLQTCICHPLICSTNAGAKRGRSSTQQHPRLYRRHGRQYFLRQHVIFRDTTRSFVDSRLFRPCPARCPHHSCCAWRTGSSRRYGKGPVCPSD
jgi:hypothetical protein